MDCKSILNVVVRSISSLFGSRVRLIFGAMLAALALSALMLGGCSKDDDDDGGGGDTWSNVTSLSQIEGTWKADPTATVSGNGVTMTANYDNYMISIDAATRMMTNSGTITTTVKGINSAQWQDLKGSMNQMAQQMGSCVAVSANDANYSFTEIHTDCSEPFPLPDNGIGQYFKINKDGTKMKVSISGIEVVYTKQSGQLSKSYTPNINIAEASPYEVLRLMVGNAVAAIYEF